MSNEIVFEHDTTGVVLYAVISNAAGQRWNTATPAFENHVDGNWADYDVALAEQGTSRKYQGDFPAGIVTAGAYLVTIYQRAGGAPAIGDSKVGAGSIPWTGAAEATPAALQAEYAARVSLTRDSANAADEYNAIWFRNVTPQLAGISVPTIQVIKRDGSNLIPQTAMTQIGATGAYTYAATDAQRMTIGDGYLVRVSATIDGQTRISETWVSRDS